MQKIYINCHFLLTEKFSGVERFAYAILLALDKIITEANLQSNFQFIAVVPKCAASKQLPTFTNIPFIYKGFGNRYIFQQISLPLIAKSALLINLCNTGAIFKRNQLVVLHDALIFAYPKSYKPLFCYIMQLTALLNTHFSHFLVTVSQFSQQEITKYTRRPADKITVITCGSEHFRHIIADEDILSRHELCSSSYILFVCSQSKAVQKNLASLHVAKYLPDTPIVVVGYLQYSELSNYPNIKFIGSVNNMELKALYAHAGCFVCPSLYEGFGLPPLEAMISSCPVLLADIPVFHEIYANAALYFDPHNYLAMADHIKLLLANHVLQQQLISKGLTMSDKYSWDKSARQLLNLCISQENK